MGTRSIISVKNAENEEICRMYKQYDGMPEATGKDIVEFIKSKEIINLLYEGVIFVIPDILLFCKFLK